VTEDAEGLAEGADDSVMPTWPETAALDRWLVLLLLLLAVTVLAVAVGAAGAAAEAAGAAVDAAGLAGARWKDRGRGQSWW
jgi:hypothetical protein